MHLLLSPTSESSPRKNQVSCRWIGGDLWTCRCWSHAYRNSGPAPRIPLSSTLNLEPAEPAREWKGKLGVISSRCSGITTTISCMYTHMCDARHADRTTDFPLTNKSSSTLGTPPARFLSFRKRPIFWQNATSSPAALFGPGQGSELT